jgi:hypothetical protein
VYIVFALYSSSFTLSPYPQEWEEENIKNDGEGEFNYDIFDIF